MKKPEDYRWCSLGYHIQTGNKDGLLSLDFGMKEWNEFNPSEIIRKYRQFVYETGAVDAGKGQTIDENIVDKARKRKYKISRVDRFRYRCRYFTRLNRPLVSGRAGFNRVNGCRDYRRKRLCSGGF